MVANTQKTHAYFADWPQSSPIASPGIKRPPDKNLFRVVKSGELLAEMGVETAKSNACPLALLPFEEDTASPKAQEFPHVFSGLDLSPP